MTQDEISPQDVIEMARLAGWEMDDSLVLEPEVIWYISQSGLETFAKLVAAHTLMNIDPSKFMSYHERKEVGDVNPV